MVTGRYKSGALSPVCRKYFAEKVPDDPEMAYRAFGVRLALLAGFALVVVLLQILAVSRLSVSNGYPWEYEYYYDRAEKWERRTPQSLPLEHVSYQANIYHYNFCLYLIKGVEPEMVAILYSVVCSITNVWFDTRVGFTMHLCINYEILCTVTTYMYCACNTFPYSVVATLRTSPYCVCVCVCAPVFSY